MPFFTERFHRRDVIVLAELAGFFKDGLCFVRIVTLQYAVYLHWLHIAQQSYDLCLRAGSGGKCEL